eukprot:12101682-Alexandrium_andersonii.AAC.1
MSASLVGSEMCIRDSPDPPLPGGLSPPGRPKSASGASWKPGAAAPRERPVSYTHLTLPTICSV